MSWVEKKKFLMVRRKTSNTSMRRMDITNPHPLLNTLTNLPTVLPTFPIKTINLKTISKFPLNKIWCIPNLSRPLWWWAKSLTKLTSIFQITTTTTITTMRDSTSSTKRTSTIAMFWLIMNSRVRIKLYHYPTPTLEKTMEGLVGHQLNPFRWDT